MSLKIAVKRMALWIAFGMVECAYAHGPAVPSAPDSPPVAEHAEQNIPAGILEFARALMLPTNAECVTTTGATLDALRDALQSLSAGDETPSSAGLARVYGALQKVLPELESVHVVLDDWGVRQDSPVVDTTSPLRLPRGSGAILLHYTNFVSTGAATTSLTVNAFQTVSADLDEIAEPTTPPTVEIPAVGSGYALIQITNAPPGRTTVQMAMKRIAGARSAAPQFCYRIVEVPPMGRLVVTLSEAGKTSASVPAMIRLTCLDDHRTYAPPNAVDFFEQSAKIAGGNGSPERGEAIPHRLGTSMAGGYYCVPGSFDVMLPQGHWEVRAFRGHETVPMVRQVEVTEHSTTTVDLQMHRWTDMAAQGWYSGDDHVHSRMSSDADAQRLLTWCRATDIRVANILSMGNYLRSFYEQRGYGRNWRVSDGDHFLVPGQEDPRFFMGHALGLNLAQQVRVPERYLHNEFIADRVRDGGGIYGHAHLVRRTASFGIDSDLTLLAPTSKSEFAEVMQCALLGTEIWYDYLNLGYRFAASAGSDMPYGSGIGEVRVYANVGPGPFTADGWFDAFRRGRTFVTNGPMLDLRVLGQGPGGVIELGETSTTVHLEAEARGYIGGSADGAGPGSAPKRLSVVVLGDTVRSVTAAEPSNGPGAESLRISMDVSLEYGGWIAISAEGADGSLAHSSPVYVQRRGYRPWAFSKVPGLLDDREKTLRQVEGVLRNLQGRLAQGQLGPQDFYNRMVAEQAPYVLEKVTAARRAYGELRGVYEAERGRRGQGMGKGQGM